MLREMFLHETSSYVLTICWRFAKLTKNTLGRVIFCFTPDVHVLLHDVQKQAMFPYDETIFFQRHIIIWKGNGFHSSFCEKKFVN